MEVTDERVIIAATRLLDFDKQKFKVSHGTVQCYIYRETPHLMIHYGRAQYARELPIMTPELRDQGQAICDDLNSGELTLEEAYRRLDQIW